MVLKLKGLGVLSVFLALFFVPTLFVHAATPLVPSNVSVDQITEPLNKVYNLIRAVVTVVGLIAITYAGAHYLFSGNNVQERESSKNMISYAVVGLLVINVAPFIVGYLMA